MRKLIPIIVILAAMCFFPSSAHAAPVHSCLNSGAGGALTFSCTASGALTAGNLLYVCSENSNNATVTWSGDSGMFVVDLPLTQVAAGGLYTTCSYVSKVGGGSATITATYSVNSSFPAIFFEEWAGFSTLDKSDTGAQGTSATPASNNITPVKNGDLLIGFVAYYNSPTVTAGSNVAWTKDATTVNMEYFTQVTAASVNAQWTLGTSQSWLAHIASFTPNVGGSTDF